MATFYSTQQTNRRALEAGSGYTLENGLNTTNGRVHTSVAYYNTAAIASGSVIEMLTIPKGARVLRGSLITGALGASVTLSVGTDNALVKEDNSTALTAAGAANLLAATAHATATVTPFCATRLLGAGGLTTAETKINLTTGGATLDADKEILVVVEYAVN
jgi:hypothetical protein